MDCRDTGVVDVVWDIETLPWPFVDSCCDKILLSHIIEHVKPWLTVGIMNECWRVIKPDSQLLIATPYAGSQGFWQDPTHTKGWIEATPYYFDPTHISVLWNVYRPRPWRIVRCNWSPYHNMEIVMQPIKDRPLDCVMCGKKSIALDDFEEHWGPCYRRYKGIPDRENPDK